MTNAVRVSHVFLMSFHSSADQTLLLKTVILDLVKLNIPNCLIRVAKGQLVRGIPRNTVVHLPLSSFTDLRTPSLGLMFCIER